MNLYVSLGLIVLAGVLGLWAGHELGWRSEVRRVARNVYENAARSHRTRADG